ncbi:MAG TPA: hypothetical protein VKB49_06230 [Candidatus Sulfotelmatobacter sp.]|nr:hypothetical protein [Candidatus Sulfotelmatobacter sp.]
MCHPIPPVTDENGIVEILVILMAPFFGAGGPMQICLRRSLRIGVA